MESDSTQSPPVTEDGAEAPASPSPGGSSFGLLTLALVVTAVAALAGGGGYAWAVHRAEPPKPQFATVDLNRINDIEQLRVATLMLNPMGSDTDKAAATKLTDNFAVDLTTAIHTAQKECGCTLFVRAAVVTSALGVPDLTPRVMQLLNINDGMDEELQARMKGYLSVTGAKGGTPNPQQAQDVVGLLSKLQQTTGVRP